MRWSLPLGILKDAWTMCVSKCRRKELNVTDEQIESGREFQIAGAAVRKEQEPKIRLVRRTCKMLEEEDNLRTWEVR